jgi:hypothetical protein
MFDRKKPEFQVHIKPRFDEAQQAVRLDIVLTIESLDVVQGSTIVSFPSLIRPTIFENDIKFTDEKGELSTAYKALDDRPSGK